jgi:hypothetical protein
MIRITKGYAQNLSHNKDVLMKLYRTAMPVKVGYTLKKILEHVGRAAQALDFEQMKLQKAAAEKHAEKDAEGKLVFDEHGDVKFPDDSARGAAGKMVYEGLAPLLKEEIEIPYDRINVEDTKLELSLAALELLSPIFAYEVAEEPTHTTQTG